MSAEAESRTLRLVLDKTRCTGLGLCESVAPDFFEVQDDGSLLLLSAEAGEQDRPLLDEAVLACPTVALRIEG